MISRRNFFAGAGASAAALLLDHPTLGALNNGILAGGNPVTLDGSPLDIDELAAWPALPATFEAQDWADDGAPMWAGAYACMPYMVTMPNGDIVSTLTVGGGVEGATDQRTIMLRSVDGGATWRHLADIEPAAAPESSWGMPWLAPTGRLYVFYTFNDGDIRMTPNANGSSATTRVDMLGVVAYRSSVDGGHTWTERRHLSLPASAIDMRNPFNGERQLIWLSGHPVSHGNAAYFGMSKWGVIGGTPATWMNDTEAFVVKAWETSPGVLSSTQSAPIKSAPVAEEPSPVVFGDGLISVTFRTNAGRLGEAVSTDDGATWSVAWARDHAGRIIAQPRGKAPQFVLPDGRLLLWGYNNNVVPPEAFPGGPRHPVYYRIGERVGDHVVWGPLRLMLFDKALTQLGYPSIVFDSDSFLVAVSDKMTARTFRFPLAGL